MSHSPALAAPISTKRDDEGRLIGLVFDSEPALVMPEMNPWLVAIDPLDNTLRAVEYAIRQADVMKTCALHLVHVQAWLSKEAAETELGQRAWVATERARVLLDANGCAWRLHVEMGEAAERISNLATRLKCGGIVVASRGLGVAEGMLFNSVTSKLMHMGGVPLVVVP